MVMIVTDQGKYIFSSIQWLLDNIFIEKFIFTAYIHIELSKNIALLVKKTE